MLALPVGKKVRLGGEWDNSIFERVRKEVDLWRILPLDGEREFDGYKLTNCICPDHTDTQKSMLAYRDGVICQACGFRADTTTVFRMFNPDLSPLRAAERLLAGDYRLEKEATRVRTTRSLDRDKADAAHLELAKRPDAIAHLEAMGFTKSAIRHFKLGLAEVLAPVLPKEYEKLEWAPGIEWLERHGEQQPYQRQLRFSVPVFEGGTLRQVIYRKWDATDLGAKVQLEARAGTDWLFNVDAVKGAGRLVIASGWGDSVVLHQWGIPSVSGISGDGTWKSHWPETLGQVKRLYLVTDADDAGVKLLKRIKAALPWTRHIALPYEIGTKKDVRDYLLDGHTRVDFEALMKKADQKATFRALRRK